MPRYLDLPTIQVHPNPERMVRSIIASTVGFEGIDSILDVGSGHGGVFDYGLWSATRLSRRATCDIHAVRDVGDDWEARDGVDVQRLDEFYEPASFDLVQCMEVLEHVPDTRTALEQLCRVARKLVLITSADEAYHALDEDGNALEGSIQQQYERLNPFQRYVGQPRVDDLRELGFTVCVEVRDRRQLIAWRVK